MGCGTSKISLKNNSRTSKTSLEIKTESNFVLSRRKAIFASKVLFIIKEVSPDTEVSRINEFESKET
ncbi:hypothetical protein SteCoe_16087 [Stentor coeruleus]|uniref:Uncharacterized protein n=1 Tax=Stentor coeruleus TaxID=5963 RepID=A0A1R2C1Z1_9CILI|nr:hypothetical protein SteCoe_16087 [Stentor coeruleus]